MGKLRMLFEARDKYPPYKDWSKSKVFAWEKIRLGYVYNTEKKIFKRLMRGLNHGNILDLACGSGRFTTIFNGEQYIGLDFSPSMIRLSKERNPQLDFVIADAFRLPFPNETFDLIFACRFIHHYTDLTAFFGEVTRLLKTNGVFVFDVTHKASLPYLIAKMVGITLYAKASIHTFIGQLKPLKSIHYFFLPSVFYGLIPKSVSKTIDKIFSRILPSRSFWVVSKTD